MNLEPLEELTEEEARLLMRAVDRAIEESPEKLDHYTELLVTIAARDAALDECERLRNQLAKASEALRWIAACGLDEKSVQVAMDALTDEQGSALTSALREGRPE